MANNAQLAPTREAALKKGVECGLDEMKQPIDLVAEQAPFPYLTAAHESLLHPLNCV